MALTRNRGNIGNINGPTVRIPVAAGEDIFRGAMVCVDAAGNLNPASATAGLIWMGVATEAVDNSAGIAGASSANIATGGGLLTVTHGAGGQTQANVGDEVTIVDDDTVNVAANTDPDIPCGRIIKVNSATEVVIALYPFATQS